MLTKEEQELAARNEYNFDHPDAFDFELLINVVRKLKKGKSIKVPVYDFTSHCRRREWVRSQRGGQRLSKIKARPEWVRSKGSQRMGKIKGKRSASALLVFSSCTGFSLNKVIDRNPAVSF